MKQDPTKQDKLQDMKCERLDVTSGLAQKGLNSGFRRAPWESVV